MAIKLSTKYTNVAPPDANYPYGAFLNATAPGALDGTPFEEAWVNDDIALKYAMLDATGIVPNEVTDTALTSQYFQALVALIQGSFPKTGGGVLQSYGRNELQDGGTYILPAADSLPVNSSVIVHLPDLYSSFEPIVEVDDTGSETIVNSAGTDTQAFFNTGTRTAIFTTDGVSVWRN